MEEKTKDILEEESAGTETAEERNKEAAGGQEEEILQETAELPEEGDPAAEVETEADAEPEEVSGRKSRLSRKERREQKEIEKKDEEIANLTDRLQRSAAEFDNYRKRTEKEKSAMYGLGVKSVIEQILPVVDNFERGLAQIPKEKEDDPVAAGMQAIYKQFQTTLDNLGVKPIEAVGKEFNPDFHNAVMHVEDDSVGENIVVEEFQKGYTYQDMVIRYSMVKVAN